MASSVEDLQTAKEINKTDTEVPYILYPFNEDSVQDDTNEWKRRKCSNRSVRYIKLLDTSDPLTLTSNEKNGSVDTFVT